MTEPSLDVLRKAITTHRAGWADASEDELRALWQSLPAGLKQEYLSVAVEDVQHATAEVTTPIPDPRREGTRGRRRRPAKQAKTGADKAPGKT